MSEKEYIERGALLKRFAELHDGGNWLVNDYNADWIHSFIETAPAADVVEVVRCCDCKYCETVIHSVIDEPQWFCTRMVRAFDVDPTSFCSYSERREQNGV